MKDTEDWVKAPARGQDRGPAVLGLVAARVYQNKQLVRQWESAATAGTQYKLEGYLANELPTRMVLMGGNSVGLAWTDSGQRRIVLIFDKASFNLVFVVTNEYRERVAVALINTMDQVLLESEKQLHFEKYQKAVSYQYNGQGTIDIHNSDQDILAFMSVPRVKGMVLIGRISRNRRAD